MKIHSLAIGVAALTALTTMSFSQINSASTAMRVKALGAVDEDAVAQFNVYLPLTHQDALEQLLEQQTDPASSNYHHWLTPAQFKEKFGPRRSDVDKATAALQASGFTVVSEKAQSLEVEGPVWAVERMFSTRMQQVKTSEGHLKFAATEERLNLPEELASLGAIIPEFTTHLAAHVHSIKMGPGLSAAYPNFRLSSSDRFYYPNDLNEAYSFPSFRTKVMVPNSRRSA